MYWMFYMFIMYNDIKILATVNAVRCNDLFKKII